MVTTYWICWQCIASHLALLFTLYVSHTFIFRCAQWMRILNMKSFRLNPCLWPHPPGLVGVVQPWRLAYVSVNDLWENGRQSWIFKKMTRGVRSLDFYKDLLFLSVILAFLMREECSLSGISNTKMVIYCTGGQQQWSLTPRWWHDIAPVRLCPKSGL